MMENLNRLKAKRSGKVITMEEAMVLAKRNERFMTAPASVQRRNDALIEMMEDSGFLYHKLDQIDARLKEMA